MRRAAPGFTLIEVMFAIAILAMSMTVVFSSNIIAARATSHARALTQATMMARCRLIESEVWLGRNQLPLMDKNLDDRTDGVTCDVIVERVELPSPAMVETAAGNQVLGRAASAAAGSSFGGATGIVPGAGDGGTPMGALAGAMSMMGGGAPGSSSGSPSSLAGAGAPSPRDMAGTMLTTVYPTVKPLLEGAIRRLTMTVRWNEGTRAQSFQVVEYVTAPGQTLPTAEQLNALTPGAPGAPGTPGSGTAGSAAPPAPALGAPPFLGGTRP